MESQFSVPALDGFVETSINSMGFCATLSSQRAMTYQFAVWSKSDLMFGGEVEAPTIDQATIKAAHEGARLAYGMQLDWDPFNLRIAIKPKRRQRRASHK